MAPLAATAGAIPYTTASAAAAAAWLRPFVLPDEFFVISGSDWNPCLARFNVSCAMKVETSEGSHVCPSDFSMLHSLLLQCPDVFVLLPHDAGYCDLAAYRIDTKDGSPIKRQDRRLPFHQSQPTPPTSAL